MFVYIDKFLNKLKGSPARKNKIILISLAISVIFNLITWGLIFFMFRPVVQALPGEQSFIPLHYNIYLGIDLYGRWERLFLMPGFGLLFITINSILAFTLYNKKQILSYFLSITTAFVQTFILVSAILIMLINI